MTRIYTTSHIRKPVEQVFDYVTTPGHWPEWHPSSLAVNGNTDHSLQVGEQVTEDYRVAGRRGRVVGQVCERVVPHRWMIEGKLVGRTGGGTVAYTLTSEDTGTFFEREFVYPTPNVVYAVLDWLIFRRQITAESSQALRQLKQILEASE
jgi:uncharacterized protein YndB with AHSA1/START domain